MIERTGAPSITEPSSAAQRRVFHSKVDTIRPTYGFEDVSLAPGTDTIEPSDVDLAQTFCGIDLAIPILASAMDAVVDARMAGRAGPPRRPRDPQPRGRPDPLRRTGRGPRADRHGRPTTTSRSCSREAYRAADPRGADRPPARGDPRGRLEGGRRRHAGRRPPVRTVLRRARCRPVPRPEPGLVGAPPRDRVRPALARRLHALHADPGRGRQHDQRRGRLRADGAGRRGRLRRRRAGRGVHDARGARASASRRSPRSATSRPRATRSTPRPVATSRSSPTAGCVAAASWPRRSPPARTS